ncbi:efflux RND transporter permease subunit [Fibrella forsythiae]|uniref:MMPL family transporter n=1 Tax=Fibrella forsythiae TaxID=2817061 RepID=A0ABS3JNV7_9BACT|nr:MMPL family transporter [Fibrella forsythiae]MBO0951684.1 MMPL family transporter [Fibrella forsythiae]
MIWTRISLFILANRRLLLTFILLATVFMGFQAARVKLSYEFAKILPTTDPDYATYEAFKARFGEDGNVMVIGAETDSMYQLAYFRDWQALNKQIKQIDGIRDVVSNAGLYTITLNDSTDKFSFRPLIDKPIQSQAQTDSLKSAIGRLPFYQGLVTAQSGDSSGRDHLMAVSFDQKKLNTRGRIATVREVEKLVDAFGKQHNTVMHLSGLPYIRTEFTAKVSNEMTLFIGLAFAVTALILLFFFRSFSVVGIAMAVVMVGVIWAVGYIVLFGYTITILSGLIPPLIIVIGVPNAIFLLNRYHDELNKGNRTRQEALAVATAKVGETTFFANVTTSIGFFVFYFTNSPLLLEFGLVASLGIMSTYATSLILIPIVFSYMPVPSEKQRGHLESPILNRFLTWVDTLVHTRRAAIYTFVGICAIAGVVGMSLIKAVGYVVDDLPKNDPIYTDLKYFEKAYHGVLPFEVSIDAGRPGRVLTPQTLTKIRLLQREFAQHPEFARPLSVVEAVKFFYQGYRGGEPRYYILPPALEMAKLQRYTGQMGSGTSRKGSVSLAAYVDSTRQFTRVSFQVADVGTARLRELIDMLQPRADSIFNFDRESGTFVPAADRYVVKLTGNSVVFTRGNEYLLRNLAESTLLAIFLVSIILIILLRDVRLSLIAILPSVVPLLVTAGLMGYFGINLKPSTILIFSIAFGLSSDGTIYFVTKYRDELRHGAGVAEAVSRTIRQTGISMVYTAFILFASFAIFTASTFQGTVSLGILVSITLLMGMTSNLVLLPAFLMTVYERRKKKVAV